MIPTDNNIGMIDFIIVFIFSHLFYFSLIMVFAVGYMGVVFPYLFWILWKKYEEWRVNQIQSK